MRLESKTYALGGSNLTALIDLGDLEALLEADGDTTRRHIVTRKR